MNPAGAGRLHQAAARVFCILSLFSYYLICLVIFPEM